MNTHRRLVVKIGSAILADGQGGIDVAALDRIVRQLGALSLVGTEIVVVSSGAVLAGLQGLGLKARPKKLPKLQAAASIGQGILMRLYEQHFAQHDRRVAQILLTQADLEHRGRYVNARNTLMTLLGAGIIPIVNENDTVAVEEITFGDNDRLSALVAHVVDADALMILTDVDGLLSEGQVVARVEQMTPELKRLARGTGRNTSLGGMASKMEAAALGMAAGIPVAVANGRRDGVVQEVLVGEGLCTWFLPRAKKMTSHQRWLAFGPRVTRGTIIIDRGARNALVSRQTSLLPSGVLEARGSFTAGDIVSIVDIDGLDVGRGLTNFSSGDIAKVCGLKTKELVTRLGAVAHAEIVHRDNLVITMERGVG